MTTLAKYAAVVLVLSGFWLWSPLPAAEWVVRALGILSGPATYLVHARSPSIFGAEWQIYATWTAFVVACGVPFFFAINAKGQVARVLSRILASGLWLLFGWYATVVLT
jgi:hypothetical protein